MVTHTQQKGNMNGFEHTSYHDNIYTALLKVGFQCWINVVFSLQTIFRVKKT